MKRIEKIKKRVEECKAIGALASTSVGNVDDVKYLLDRVEKLEEFLTVKESSGMVFCYVCAEEMVGNEIQHAETCILYEEE